MTVSVLITRFLRIAVPRGVTLMADNALNKDHSDTTSMPINMVELDKGIFDQELTLRLLGSEEDALDHIDGALADRGRRAATARFGLRPFFPDLPPLSLPSLNSCVALLIFCSMVTSMRP
jgi:hypothetical protein